ncbi:sialyltransferase-like protein 1, partial [Tanacetum coccineum]
YPVTSSTAGVKKMCEILYCSTAGDIMSKRSVPISSLWVVVDTTIAFIFFYCFFAALVALLCSCRDSGEGIVLRKGAKGTGMKSVELALSICDIVDIYGFTVDPGYTEWTRYFSEPRKGHNALKEGRTTNS